MLRVVPVPGFARMCTFDQSKLGCQTYHQCRVVGSLAVGFSQRALRTQRAKSACVSQGDEEPFIQSPYGLDILDNCMTCPVREQHIFCNLSPPMVQRLNDITSSAIYPRGAMLFMEGQQGRGAFVPCTGKAKLFAVSRDDFQPSL